MSDEHQDIRSVGRPVSVDVMSPRSGSGRACNLVLFTRDLRTHDHPALHAASRRGAKILPLFVLDKHLLERSPNRHRLLLEILLELDQRLASLGSPLWIAHGRGGAVCVEIAKALRCDAVHLTADAGTIPEQRLAQIREGCEHAGIAVHVHPGHSVVEAGAVAPAGADAYRVFTPYYRAWCAAARRPLSPRPRRLRAVSARPRDFARFPSPRLVVPDARRLPRVGEVAARAALQRFLRRGVGDYEHLRDRLDHQGTSRLSTHLRFGTISALEVSGLAEDRGGESFVRQLVWRDFFHQLVAADPSLTQRDLRPERSGPIATDPDALEDWCQGRTGVPLVDAGMRQLLQEGWMPNRARLVVASYLTRVLGISWRLGAAHFDRHLTDGDPSSNAGNWQWVAGTGASSRRGVALNIDRQAARFDPDGTYRAAGADPPEGPAS